MDHDPPFLLVACAHPSLDDAVRRFCDALRAEPRCFGRRAWDKPSPSFLRRLQALTHRLCLVAVRDGGVIGAAAIDEDADDGPELLVAVGAGGRGCGVTVALGQALLERAHDAGVPRVVVHTSHRRSELRELGEALGFRAVDLGRGRVDLVRTLAPASRTA